MKKNDSVKLKSWGRTISTSSSESIHLKNIYFPEGYSQHKVRCLGNNPTNKNEMYKWNYDYSLIWKIYAIGMSRDRPGIVALCLVNHKLKTYVEAFTTNVIQVNKPIKLYKYILNTN